MLYFQGKVFSLLTKWMLKNTDKNISCIKKNAVATFIAYGQRKDFKKAAATTTFSAGGDKHIYIWRS